VSLKATGGVLPDSSASILRGHTTDKYRFICNDAFKGNINANEKNNMRCPNFISRILAPEQNIQNQVENFRGKMSLPGRVWVQVVAPLVEA
jgi:hypothetical protein